MGSARVAFVGGTSEMRAAAAAAFDDAPAHWDLSFHDAAPQTGDVVVLAPGVEGRGVTADPRDPERFLEVLEAEIGRRRTGCIVVTGTGGSGATTLALHLARCFAAVTTCLIDLDVVWGGAARRLSLPPGARTWLEMDGDVHRAALPVPGGFRILCAPVGSDLSADPFSGAAGIFDRLVIDAPAGAALDLAAGRAAAGVLVVQPTRTSTERAAVLLDRHPELPWAVVCNRVGHGGDATGKEVAAELGRAVALDLPCTPALRSAEHQGRLVHPLASRWARRVQALATALVDG